MGAQVQEKRKVGFSEENLKEIVENDELVNGTIMAINRLRSVIPREVRSWCINIENNITDWNTANQNAKGDPEYKRMRTEIKQQLTAQCKTIMKI